MSDERIIQENMIVPMPAFVIACATALVSIAGCLLKLPYKHSHIVSMSSYLLLGTTVGYLVFTTGMTSSPFIALWLLVAVFAGLFGAVGLAGAFLAVNGYLVAEIVLNGMPDKNELIIFGLAGELPLLASYIIWHSKNRHEDEKDRAFSDLAAELSEVSDKSQVVINAITDGVIAIDNKAAIQLINPAAQSTLGWSQQDALGLNYDAVLKLSDKQGNSLNDANNPIQQVLTTHKGVVNNDLSLMTNSGKQIIVSLVVSPVGTNGAGAIIVFRDITEQKKEERQQTEFISTASHEMRTPVASIEGYLGLALNPSTATIDDKARQYLTKAHESAQHLGRLFQDLLDITKAEDGRLSNNPGIIDVVSFAGDITTGFEVKAQQKNLMLYFKPGTPSDTGNDLNKKISPVYYVDVDPDHLREVLSNLIENAIKYTPQGEVTIDVNGNEESVTISIHDSGIGIPPEDIGHLFQKFYRVDNSATREIGGTGLGLYLCRRLVETMNGKIWAESEFGKGSTFFIQFNRVSHEDAMAKLEAAAVEDQRLQNASAQIPQQPTLAATPQVTTSPTAITDTTQLQQPQPVEQVFAQPLPEMQQQPVVEVAQPIQPPVASVEPQPQYTQTPQAPQQQYTQAPQQGIPTEQYPVQPTIQQNQT